MIRTLELVRTRPVTIALALATMGLGGCSGGESAGTAAAQAVRIAFTVNRDGFGEIWLMRADGSGRRRLTAPKSPGTDASGSMSPAWSPDGRSIAFASTGRARREDVRDVEIYVMRSDGSRVRRLTFDRVSDSHPTWSPDGRKIAFAHAPNWGHENADSTIVSVDVATGRHRQITRHPAAGAGPVFDLAPAWSPRGELIAFTRVRYVPGQKVQVSIYVVRPDGGGERLLIADGAEPAWSRDGRRMAFTSTRDAHGTTCFHDCTASREIYVARSDGGAPRRLTRTEADEQAPSWSWHGDWIAFVSDRSNRRMHANEIYVMKVDGGRLRRLTRTAVWDLEPVWEPKP